MNNEPVAYWDGKHFASKDKSSLANIPLYTHPHPDNLGLAESIIKQQQLKIDNLYENNARLDAEIDALKTQPVNPYQSITDTKIEPTVVSYTHPVKELHLSLQKDKETGELLAVTYTDDEHRIVEVLWEKPPVKELTDEEIVELGENTLPNEAIGFVPMWQWIDFARAILRKAQEK